MAREYYITNITSVIPYKDAEEKKSICDMIKDIGFVLYCVDQPRTSFFVDDSFDNLEEAREALEGYVSTIWDDETFNEIHVYGYYIEIYDEADEGASLEYEEGILGWDF